MLNNAMLLQCPAQLQSLTPALCFSILKEPVDELAAGKRALVHNAVFLPELQDGVLVAYETEDTDRRARTTKHARYFNRQNEQNRTRGSRWRPHPAQNKQQLLLFI